MPIVLPHEFLQHSPRKGGQLQGRMQERSLTDRVRVLASQIGITGASAHDGRHAFVTFAIRGGTDLKSLQDAGGWNSIVMPARYAESHKIANKGVRLGE
jgi:site-specific recombinase XerD